MENNKENEKIENPVDPPRLDQPSIDQPPINPPPTINSINDLQSEVRKIISKDNAVKTESPKMEKPSSEKNQTPEFVNIIPKPQKPDEIGKEKIISNQNYINPPSAEEIRQSVEAKSQKPIPNERQSTKIESSTPNVLNKEISLEEKNRRLGQISPIHTFKEDVSKTVSSDNLTLSKIVMAEQKNKPSFKRVNESRLKFNSFIIIISILLVFFGLLTIGLIFFLSKNSKNPEVVIKQEVIPIISTDNSEEISTSGKSRLDLAKDLAIEIESNIIGGKINRLIFTSGETPNKERIDTKELLEVFGGENIPPELSRALSDNYLLGIYSINGNQPFLIIPVNSYSNGLAGMLKWERAMMPVFIDMFALERISKDFSNSLNFETRSDRVFKDGIVQNINVRFVTSQEEILILLYAFIDKNTLVITTNDLALIEIVKRYKSNKLIR